MRRQRNRTQSGTGRQRRTVSLAHPQAAPSRCPQQRMARPPIDVVEAQLHGEAPVAVRAGNLVRHNHDGKTLVLRRNLVSRPQVLLRDLDDAYQRLGLCEVVCFYPLNERFPLDPGDGPEPGTAEGVPPANPVPDMELDSVYVDDRNPAALVTLDPFRPAP